MKVVRKCIEYYGIAEYIPCDVLGFNDFTIEEKKKLSSKPKINYFTKCSATVEKSVVEIINLEARENRYKINVEGNLIYRVEYVSVEYKNLICTDRGKVKFNIDIDVFKNIDIYKKVIANIFIEDIFLTKINDENYSISFSILGVVEE